MKNLKNDYTFENLTDQEKLEIAVLIANDTLKTVNLKCKEVHLKSSIYNKYIKRLFDIVLSFIALIITAPVNLILLVGTLIDVGCPILFFQTRIGKDMQLFSFGKFRNMREERDENDILLPAYQRVTKWGSFVRKTSLDELLNFWYIFIGKMSIIGPRPMPAEYLNRFNSYHVKRHMIKPGLECPLHTSEFGREMTWENRFENDIWYVENISFLTDIKMLLLLIQDTFFNSRRVQRSKAEIGTFMGYDTKGKIIESDHIPDKYYDMIYALRREIKNEKECIDLSK